MTTPPRASNYVFFFFFLFVFIFDVKGGWSKGRVASFSVLGLKKTRKKNNWFYELNNSSLRRIVVALLVFI
jgi:serine/threonine protein phosphatase PrpC